jgi:HEAT repeat protein
MNSQPKPTECPSCHSKNVQAVGKDGWFCLDCDWNNLPAVTGEMDALISTLRHGDTEARREAAQALINMGDFERHLATSDDLTPLLEALDDADDDVRYFATVALGKLGDTRALAKLKHIVHNDSSRLVREGAKTAIEWIED